MCLPSDLAGRTSWFRVRSARKSLARLGMALALASAILPQGGSADADEAKKHLRVCGDPNNMPFSNEKREGIENEIATVLAKDLGWELEYVWWSHQRGLVKRVLNTERCDVLLGIPKGYDLVTWTKPYYRSAYVIVTKTDGGPKIASLDDPALRQVKRIGVHMNTPPSDVLGDRGLQDNMRTYITLNDPRDPDPERRPLKMLEDVVSGQIDAAIACCSSSRSSATSCSRSACCSAFARARRSPPA